MLSISSNKTNKFISIYPDTRYKLMLGYSSYFVNNVKKYRDSIEPFKTKRPPKEILCSGLFHQTKNYSYLMT